MTDKTRTIILATLFPVLVAACAHTVAVKAPPMAFSSQAQLKIPLAVTVIIDPALRSYEAQSSMYAGAVKHSFDIPIGPPLAAALEDVVRSGVSDPVFASHPRADRPTLSLALSGEPRVNMVWEMGLFLVGQRTDCMLPVEGRLVSEKGEQIWQTVVVGDGHNETRRPINVPTAGQAEPAIRQAIEVVATDLISRLRGSPEVRRYAE